MEQQNEWIKRLKHIYQSIALLIQKTGRKPYITYNNQQHADQMKTPLELMFGESPITLPLSFENTKYPAVEDRMKTLIKNREEALAAHELARTCMADRQKSTFIPFKKGDKVWLDSRNMKTQYNKMMKPKWEGPFIIAEVLGPVTYRLQLPSSWRIHNVFHTTLCYDFYSFTHSFSLNCTLDLIL